MACIPKVWIYARCSNDKSCCRLLVDCERASRISLFRTVVSRGRFTSWLGLCGICCPLTQPSAFERAYRIRPTFFADNIQRRGRNHVLFKMPLEVGHDTHQTEYPLTNASGQNVASENTRAMQTSYFVIRCCPLMSARAFSCKHDVIHETGST